MKDKTRYYINIIIIISLMMLMAGCSKNLLVATFSQEFGEDRNVYDIITGWVAYEELSGIQQNKMSALGYKSGDIVPSVCIMPTGRGTGSIYIPKSSESGTDNINLQDWINIDDWADRNK